VEGEEPEPGSFDRRAAALSGQESWRLIFVPTLCFEWFRGISIRASWRLILLPGEWGLKSGDKPPIALFGKGARVPICYYRIISYSSVYHISGLISSRFGVGQRPHLGNKVLR
jgi:hypothetical protein